MEQKEQDKQIEIAIQHFQAGHFTAVESICLEILTECPENAEALHLMGQLLAYSGLVQAGLELVQRAVDNAPDRLNYHITLAELQRQMGDPQCLNSIRHVILLDPCNPKGYIIAAKIFVDQWRWYECYAQAHFAMILDNHQNIHSEALEIKSIAQKQLDIHTEQDILILLQNQAQKDFHQGEELEHQGQAEDANNHYTHALDLKPDLADAENALGNLLRKWGYPERAIPHHQRAIFFFPNYVDYRINLALAYEKLGNYRDAESCYKQAVDLEPENSFAISSLALFIDKRGDSSKALELITPFLKRSEVSYDLSFAYATIATTEADRKKASTLIESCLMDTQMPQDNRRLLLFTLGNIQDKLGLFDQAFSSYQQANQLYSGGHARHEFRPDEHKDLFERIKYCFTKDNINTFTRSDHFSELPIFIVGMPRSGTSLVEQMLASHPKVYGAGEREDINRMAIRIALHLSSPLYPEYIHQLDRETVNTFSIKYLAELQALDSGAERVTDKMPTNFFYLGLISLLFPGARIIHCFRNPIDTCLSCYFHDFQGHPYSYDLRHLGIYYREYYSLVEHWKSVLSTPILDVCYEQLVRDPEEKCREIVGFCGLSWDPQCLNYYESARLTRTASYKQVRQPIYTSSIGRYKQYKKHLTPLFDIFPELEEV